MRAYTLLEIDQMRSDLLMIDLLDGPYQSLSMEDREKICEDHLRTYMTGSVEPRELYEKAVQVVKSFTDKGGTIVRGGERWTQEQ